MYVNTSFPNIVYALDLSKPGAPQIWKYVPNQSPDAIPIACCDLVNRGTAYSPSGKIYIQALQGELIALDAKTGKELWKAKHPDKSNAGVEANGYKQGATMTNAPIYIKTKSGKEIVIAGISGGEFGVRGRVSAFDANTGAHMWTALQHRPGQRSPHRRRRERELSVAQGQGPRRLDLAGRRVEAGRRHHLGLVLLRPRARPLLLQRRQPGHLEPRPAAGRQQVVDDHLRAQARTTGTRCGPTR